MKIDLIKEAAGGNLEKEMNLLEIEINQGTKEIDIYTRLCQLYRKKKDYFEAAKALKMGWKILNHS